MSRRRSHDLGALVGRIGRRAAARRLGISERTVGDWLRRGVPGKRLAEIATKNARSAAAQKAAATRDMYERLGWTRLHNFDEVDRMIGAESGHALQRWRHRKMWWLKNRPHEHLPKRIAIIRDKEGRLYYVNGDEVLWRAYMVDGRLFWSTAEKLAGYDTPEQMKGVYDSLQGHDLVLEWPDPEWE